jgi:hypothetical protein
MLICSETDLKTRHEHSDMLVGPQEDRLKFCAADWHQVTCERKLKVECIDTDTDALRVRLPQFQRR